MPSLINEDPAILAMRHLSWREVVALDPRVSSRSVLSDAVWYLDHHFDSRSPLECAVRFPDDRSRDRSDLFRFLAFKLFVARDGEVRLSPSTSTVFSAGLKHVVQFMDGNEYIDFGSLTKDAFRTYCATLAGELGEVADVEAVSDFAEWADEIAAAEASSDMGELEDGEAADDTPIVVRDGQQDAAEPGAEDDAADAARGAATNAARRATRGVALARLNVWAHISRLGPSLRRARARPMRHDPFSKENFGRMAVRLSGEAGRPVAPIPDDVALAMVERGIRMLGTPAEDVIALHAEWDSAFDRRDGPTPFDVVTGWKARTLDGEKGPWATAPSKTDCDATGGRYVREFIKQIQCAAVEVFGAFTALRIAETFSPRVGERIHPRVPACVDVEPSLSGDLELFMLNGKVYKARLVPEDERWVIGCRPVGSTEIPPPVLALDVLERLLAPLRARAADPEIASRLLVVPRKGGTPPYADGVAALPSIRHAAARLAWNRQLDLSHLPDVDADGRDLRPYKKDLGLAAPYRAWRPTWAIFMFRSTSVLKSAISRHFKHLYLGTLDASYIQNRSAILETARSMQLRDTALFLKAIANGEEAGAGLFVDEARRIADRIRALVDGEPDHSMLDRLEVFARDHDLRLYRSRWSFCIPGWDPENAACRRIAGTANWDARSPSFATRSPCVCAGCRLQGMDGTHVGFWAEGHREWTVIAEETEGAERNAAIRQRDQAAAVLRRLGVAGVRGCGSTAAVGAVRAIGAAEAMETVEAVEVGA